MEAEKRIGELIAESRACGRPIIYIQHFNPPNDTFFPEGTFGAEISGRIRPRPEDKVIIKRYPNRFLETELDAYLKSLQADTLMHLHSLGESHHSRKHRFPPVVSGRKE